ncbi:16432_t:CDS:2 [Funneliformis geosporum]|nr:16432_t:CDS:2 [Funneliformis geosporum]
MGKSAGQEEYPDPAVQEEYPDTAVQEEYPGFCWAGDGISKTTCKSSTPVSIVEEFNNFV